MYYLRLISCDLLRRTGVLLTLCALGAGVAGCNDKFFDPSQVGRFRPTPAVNVILDSLGVAEEAPVAWEKGDEPRPEDIVAVKSDYALRAGDLIRISIFELLQESVPLVSDYVVSETGNVSIPEVGVVQAAGLTETQLEEEIKRILTPGILRQPSVTVTLLDSQQRTFSALGNGVARPGRYVVPRYDFRLTDALATAGAQLQYNVSYVYVSRRDEAALGPVEAAPVPGEAVPELEFMEPQRPQGRSQPKWPPAPEAGDAATSVSQRDIPEPTERAEPYELEREMLDLIAPDAKGASNTQLRIWEPSQNVGVIGRSPESAKGNDVAATSLPHGFRLVAPSKWRGLADRETGRGRDGSVMSERAREVQPREIVQTPAEFGNAGPAEAPAGEPGGKERIEWVFRDGKWVPLPVPGREQGPPPVAEGKPEGEIEWVFRNGKWVPLAAPGQEERIPPTAEARPEGEIEWVFRDGRWIPLQKAVPQPARPPVTAKPEGPTLPLDGEELPADMEWEQAIQTRLIRIPADKLLAGDPRYNVIIKPGDAIHVPLDIMGEFAIMGNVNRSGFINITGRPMTLKMAIAAAGGLGPLAWPKTVEVVRRVGTRKEQIVLVDLDKIASGEQPDFFIKPNDLINVGTHPTSLWRLVLRNAFRATYGFGFIYDRNFADMDYGESLTF